MIIAGSGLCWCVVCGWGDVYLWPIITLGILCTGLCWCVLRTWGDVYLWPIITTGILCTGLCWCVVHAWDDVYVWPVITTGILCTGLCWCVGHTWNDVRLGPVLYARLATQRAAERVPGSPWVVTLSLHGSTQLHWDERGTVEKANLWTISWTLQRHLPPSSFLEFVSVIFH